MDPQHGPYASRSSWSSESDLPWAVGTSNSAVLAASHCETGRRLCAFWSWRARPISGTCHNAMLLAPACRSLVWPIPRLRSASLNVSVEDPVGAGDANTLFCQGLIRNDQGTLNHGYEVGRIDENLFLFALFIRCHCLLRFVTLLRLIGQTS